MSLFQIYGYLLARKAYTGGHKDVKKLIFFSFRSTLVVLIPAFSEDVQSLSVFWDVSQDDEHLIANQLKSISAINWTQPVFFYAVPMVLLEKLQTLALRGVLGDGYLTPHRILICHLYSLASQPELEPRLPEGFELRRLRDEHGGIMYDHWKNNFSETTEAYKGFLRAFPSAGVFQTSGHCKGVADSQASNDHQRIQDDEHSAQGSNMVDSPVAWSHISPFNVLTNTYTLPKYRGQKLGLAVTLALAKVSIQETGFAAACVADDNYASIKLHESAGFTRQHPLGYQYFKSSLGTCFLDGPKDLCWRDNCGYVKLRR
ncbi:uncharacterized protein [Macrobrachium rosenbergii]|uniref:uncharacterized protein n=1 Tax=Macrobrachium rosenbergii TaxID=79674 RepID=UPI0034D67D6D